MSAEDLFAQMMGMMEKTKDRKEPTYERAPFGWPGGKAKSIENITPHLPYRNSYGEPFGGSGAILLSRRPCNLEIYNDRYGGVVAFYRVIRDRAKMDLLLDRLNLCLHSREEFVWSRDTWKDCEDDVERAARWWYMVTCSFANLGRNFGRALKDKSQFGGKLKSNLRYFSECNLRLQKVQIENLDWRDILNDYDSKQMVWYLDPPYYQTTKGQYECELTQADHEELLERCQKLQGFVALSGYDNPLYSNPRFKWSRKLQWKKYVTSTPLVTAEKGGYEQQRGFQLETLWIKE